MPVVRVIGLGNEDAGDDAAGLLAVRAARDLAPDGSGVEFRVSLPGASLIDALDGADDVVLVDAVRELGGPGHPGRVVRIELGRGADLAGVAPSLSSHGLGVAESVALARALGRRPRIVFLGVHASSVSVGEDLSPRVMAALPRLVAMIRLEVERALGGPTVEGSRSNRSAVVP
jgi:hydrogenase maturation protease